MDYAKFNHQDFNKWIKDKGDLSHRLNYDLNKNSIVIDVGGYKGEWSEKIYKKYGCIIFVFEPIKKYFDLISEKFKNNNNIKVFNFGLSNESKELEIYHSNDSSSVFLKTESSEKIKIENFIEFIKLNNLSEIDLMKINIEGGEYELINGILKNNIQSKIKDIQIQFHRFIPDCIEKRNNIRNELSKTHNLTYDYEFIWENWKIK